MLCLTSLTFLPSTILKAGKGGKVTSAGWQVTLCDPIWYVISRSGEVKFTNCYILLTYFTYFTFTFHRSGGGKMTTSFGWENNGLVLTVSVYR